jgi:carbon storage regulator
MLVLSRKPNEKIHVGENIVVTVVKIEGGHVRIGIDAPTDIGIFREEVLPGGTIPEPSAVRPSSRQSNRPARPRRGRK